MMPGVMRREGVERQSFSFSITPTNALVYHVLI